MPWDQLDDEQLSKNGQFANLAITDKLLYVNAKASAQFTAELHNNTERWEATGLSAGWGSERKKITEQDSSNSQIGG